MKKMSTKRALLMSVISLMLCIAMLVGTTYAWFTDVATTGVNSITTGKLSVDLVGEDGNTLEERVLSFRDKNGNTNILWEPGASFELDPFKVVNTGNLWLKYKLELSAFAGDVALLDVIDFSVLKADGTTVSMDTFFNDQVDQALAPAGKTGAESDYFTIIGTMSTEAGNKYQGKTLQAVELTVYATQMTEEPDSFGTNYDALATYAGQGKGRLEDGQTAVSIEVRDKTEAKVASAEVPADAIDPNAEEVVIEINESDYKGNFTVAANSETAVFDITATGLKDGNTEELKMKLRIQAGLDPATVKLYHFSDEIACSYDPTDGYVTFHTATFSPFTVVFDAESKYEAPTTGEVPTVDLSVREDWIGNADIPWGSYGQWSPTEGLNSTPEAAYTFKCVQSAEEAKASPYAYWECDFFVKLDRDLAPNQIFLGGYYAQWDAHVGFHNGDFTLEAGKEIPMLGSVGGAWTYAAIAEEVGEFVCCVADVDDALKGANFTVTLRLTNPETGETIDVETVTHTFA